MPLPAAVIGVLGSLAGAVGTTAVELGGKILASDKGLSKAELKRELGKQFSEKGKKVLNKSGLDF